VLGCDYRKLHPYLNQESKDRQFCLAQSSSASMCREFVSLKNVVLDQQKATRLDQGKAARSRKANFDARVVPQTDFAKGIAAQ
jgi:hypothetical protein